MNEIVILLDVLILEIISILLTHSMKILGPGEQVTHQYMVLTHA